MSDTNGQTFYDIVLKKLNNQINELQIKYDNSLLKIKDLQLRLAKYEPETVETDSGKIIEFDKLK